MKIWLAFFLEHRAMSELFAQFIYIFAGQMKTFTDHRPCSVPRDFPCGLLSWIGILNILPFLFIHAGSPRCLLTIICTSLGMHCSGFDMYCDKYAPCLILSMVKDKIRFSDILSTWMKGPGGIPVWALLKLAESNAQPACKGHKAGGFPSSLVNSWNVFLSPEGSVRQLERECVRFDVLCADDSQLTRANGAWVFFYFLPDCSLQKELTGEKYLSIGSVIAQPIHLIRVCVHVVVLIHVLSAYHFHNCTGRIRGLEAECSGPHLG